MEAYFAQTSDTWKPIYINLRDLRKSIYVIYVIYIDQFASFTSFTSILDQLMSNYINLHQVWHFLHVQKSRGVFFPKTKKNCGRHIDHGVVGGTHKSTNNQQNPQDTCSKNLGACFFQKTKKLREAHRPRGAWRGPESMCFLFTKNTT